MNRFVKKLYTAIIQPTFSLFGLAIVRNNDSLARGTMRSALAEIARRESGLNTIVDIGASNGSWSELAMMHLSHCNYLLIEAQKVHEYDLKRFCSDHSNAEFVLAAAGEAKGQIYFDTSDPFGGQASNVPYATNNEILPVTTIDSEIQARKLRGPFLLKFDTHGFEIPILRGACETLRNTEVIVMECYNYRISADSLLFDEMCLHLKGHGFRCIDLVEPLYRPHDNTFWQMDMIFVRETRPEFEYLSYE